MPLPTPLMTPVGGQKVCSRSKSSRHIPPDTRTYFILKEILDCAASGFCQGGGKKKMVLERVKNFDRLPPTPFRFWPRHPANDFSFRLRSTVQDALKPTRNHQSA